MKLPYGQSCDLAPNCTDITNLGKTLSDPRLPARFSIWVCKPRLGDPPTSQSFDRDMDG